MSEGLLQVPSLLNDNSNLSPEIRYLVVQDYYIFYITDMLQLFVQDLCILFTGKTVNQTKKQTNKQTTK